jgi:hypothetical protein
VADWIAPVEQSGGMVIVSVPLPSVPLIGGPASRSLVGSLKASAHRRLIGAANGTVPLRPRCVRSR